jgi:hypothetical protein
MKLPKRIAAALALFILILQPGLETTAGAADQPQLARVVYITLSQACGCTLKRCQAGDAVVDQVFVGTRQSLLTRLDYSEEPDKARHYIQKYRVALPPSLLFLDQQGNLLWSTMGRVDQKELEAKLQQFGA